MSVDEAPARPLSIAAANARLTAPGSRFEVEEIATEAERRAFVAARIAAFKVPLKVDFAADTLPRNANGKIVKAEVKTFFEA
jgi:acyl-coenzyme A synthetase/AMP-(fatty) acid ligase